MPGNWLPRASRSMLLSEGDVRGGRPTGQRVAETAGGERLARPPRQEKGMNGLVGDCSNERLQRQPKAPS